jgi:hypothetical protein
MFCISVSTYANENINNIDTTANCNCNNTNIYERPYSLVENCPKENMIRINSGVFLAAGVGAMGLLYAMPESFTGWDKSSMSFKNIFGKWWDNVAVGPVFDKDNWVMNYVAHPYCGAIYYMDTRSAGYNAVHSFLFSIGMSTFMWEYGFEAFAEVPSINDLLITPIAGSVIGELFYLIKRKIVQNDEKVLNSPFIGHTILFLIDPINEVSHWLVPEKIGEQLNSTLIVQPNYVGVAIRLKIL